MDTAPKTVTMLPVLQWGSAEPTVAFSVLRVANKGLGYAAGIWRYDGLPAFRKGDFCSPLVTTTGTLDESLRSTDGYGRLCAALEFALSDLPSDELVDVWASCPHSLDRRDRFSNALRRQFGPRRVQEFQSASAPAQFLSIEAALAAPNSSPGNRARLHREVVRKAAASLRRQDGVVDFFLRRQDELCGLCRQALPADRSGCELDHIVPVSGGGWTTLSNLRLLCTPCNSSRPENLLNQPVPLG